VTSQSIEHLVRALAPQVLGALVRRYGAFDAAEDAVQEALIAASTQWPGEGVPEHPRAWLVSVASRRLIDEWRSSDARRRREERAALELPSTASDVDDSLTLLFLCCHPALSRSSQVALTLRAVGGLTTAEIARAFLVPEATMAQRISRAKQQIRSSGASFELPAAEELADRLAVVLQVIYLIFNEGYTPGSRGNAGDADLAAEAIRLGRMLRREVPDSAEVVGLLALMLLVDARRPAREDAAGRLVPLAEQDRSLWDSAFIREGIDLVTDALGSGPIGPYQVQAAIAAVHDEARTGEATDWPQILALYGVLERISPGPVVTLNRAVALAMVSGPRAGLALLGTIEGDPGLAGSHRFDSVRASLLELAGDAEGARRGYLRAFERATNVAERDYLALKAAAVRPDAANS
jgi:RNA polymerase sigma factor (sigma-70 family)